MSRVTKEIASKVAKQLTAKKLEEIINLEKEISTKFEDIYLSRLSKEIKETFKKQKNYFYTRKQFQVSGSGFDYIYINTLNDVPYNKNSSFVATDEEAKILLPLTNKKKLLKGNYDKLVIEIEALLYGLRTYSKVIAEFPEAEPFLPYNLSNKLMINVSEIRNQLK